MKLNNMMCPTAREEKENMNKVPYSSIVESLMYAMVCTRPNIAHAVGVVIRFLENPEREHWEALKWILRYLRGSSDECLCFGASNPILKGYTDSDMAGDLDKRKSTTGYLFTFSGGLYHGSQSCRSVLHYLQLKLSILRLLKPTRR